MELWSPEVGMATIDGVVGGGEPERLGLGEFPTALGL